MIFNYSGFEWLLIDAASQYGMDKKPYIERLAFAQEWLADVKVDSLVELKANFKDWVSNADDKASFMSAIICIWDVYRGVAISRFIPQDSASSGPQWLSTMFRCETGMHETGVLGTKVPDLYNAVGDKLGVKIPRKKLKKGMIPHMYQSKAAPEAVFGDDYEDFLHAFAQTVPRADATSAALADSWDSSALEYRWELPDGFQVFMPVTDTIKIKLGYLDHKYEYHYTGQMAKQKGKAKGTKALAANTVHSFDAYVLRELVRRCNYSPLMLQNALTALNQTKLIKGSNTSNVKQMVRLNKLFNTMQMPSAVAFEYIDPVSVSAISPTYKAKLIALAESMLEVNSFEVQTIHDDFRCLPNYVTAMKLKYNVLLQEAYLGSWGKYILEHITHRKVVILPVDMDIAAEMLDAPYAIS